MLKIQGCTHLNLRPLAAPLLAALLSSGAPLAAAHEAHHQHQAAPASTPTWEETAIRVPDLPVVNQDGQPKHFSSDLVQGRTVAINFMYTSCSAVCSPMTATLSQVQRDLAARGGKVEFISVSVDPTTDQPAVLKEFAQRFGISGGWNFVTGEPADITQLLDAFGLRAGNKDDHTPIIFISNGTTGKWTRAYGLASAKSIGDAIAEAAGLGAAPVQPAASSSEPEAGTHDAHEGHASHHGHHS